MEKVQLPVGLEIIESYVFNTCIAMETINLPRTLKEIGPCAFQNCTALDNVIIPYSVTKIHDNAFKDTKLTRVVVNNRNTDISNTAFPGNVKQFCCPPPPEGTDLKDDKLYQYAQAHGFTYIPFSLGDLNHSGDVDQRDVRKVLEEYTTVSVLHMDSILTETERIEADINSNGKIDARDSLLLLNYHTEKFVSKTLDENIFLPDYLLTQK
ncbi:MAG: leucine-rich repeat protein [Oscillospiraceae bacterium]|nr:leucine-rich repeat protein [Oscillospiraceae bacterium]